MKRIILTAALLASISIGCKKEITPEGAATTATATVPAIESVPPPPVEVPDSGVAALAGDNGGLSPLGALDPAKKVAPTSTASAKPKVDPPDCIKARSICANPTVATNSRIKKLCEDQKAACTKAGGKI